MCNGLDLSDYKREWSAVIEMPQHIKILPKNARLKTLTYQTKGWTIFTIKG